jgi:hypothetical protein
MSMLSMYQNRVGKLRSDIATLNKKLAPEKSNQAKKSKEANSTAASITRSISASKLRETLLSAARSKEAVTAEEDEYGKRYVLDFEMRTAVGTATVRSGWIVRHGEDFPRLTSCYVV